MQQELDMQDNKLDMTWLETSDVFRYSFDWQPRLSRKMEVHVLFNGGAVPPDYVPAGISQVSHQEEFKFWLDRIIIGWHLDDYLLHRKPQIEVRMNKKQRDGRLVDTLQFHTDYYDAIGNEIILPKWMIYKARSVVRASMLEKSSRWSDFDSSGDIMRNVLFTAGGTYRELMPLVKKVFGEDYQPDMFVEPRPAPSYGAQEGRELNSELADEVMNIKHGNIRIIDSGMLIASSLNNPEMFRLLGGTKNKNPEYINVTFHLNPGFPWDHTSIQWITYYYDAITMERVELVCALSRPGQMWSINSISPGKKSKLKIDSLGSQFRNIPTPAWMDRTALRWANKAKDEAVDKI